MGITIHYQLMVDSEEKVDRITERFSSKSYDRKIVDCPFDFRLLESGYMDAPDMEQNWEEYALHSMADIIKGEMGNRLPERFKGAVLLVDNGCEPFWLTFGDYGEQGWWNRHFTKTQYAREGFRTHVEIINMLRELNEMADYLKVIDETGLWESGDLEAAAGIFRQNEITLKAFGTMLRDASRDAGLEIEAGYNGQEEDLETNREVLEKIGRMRQDFKTEINSEILSRYCDEIPEAADFLRDFFKRSGDHPQPVNFVRYMSELELLCEGNEVLKEKKRKLFEAFAQITGMQKARKFS